MTAPPRWPVVWIAGASTGIGRSLALQLAAKGCRVAVSARSREKLDALCAEQPRLSAYPLDVTDAAAVAETIAVVERDLGPIDLAILAAGAWTPMTIDTLSADVFRDTNAVNYLGVTNAVSILAPLMARRGKGHLAWIASVAGYVGLPKAYAYGPTKAALINLAESLAPELESKGVAVSVINPGFVETPLTAKNDFPMPFLMSPDEAARRTIEGLEARQFEIAFPRRMVALLKGLRQLPYPALFAVLRRGVLKG
ncbi:MAG: SDR family NAD(P)-dependent oxidoreductase [Hyphomicrobiales bacterium]